MEDQCRDYDENEKPGEFDDNYKSYIVSKLARIDSEVEDLEQLFANQVDGVVLIDGFNELTEDVHHLIDFVMFYNKLPKLESGTTQAYLLTHALKIAVYKKIMREKRIAIEKILADERRCTSSYHLL